MSEVVIGILIALKPYYPAIFAWVIGYLMPSPLQKARLAAAADQKVVQSEVSHASSSQGDFTGLDR
jgi:hypothetical protein